MKMIKFILLMLFVLTSVFLVFPDGRTGATEDRTDKAKGETGALWESCPPPVGQNPLFVDLEKVNDRYVIARVSNQPLRFRLNDFKPQFDIQRYYCTKREGQYLPQVNRPEMCKDDEKRFRRVKVDVWNTMATDFVTFIVDVFRGNVEQYSVFELEEYRSAIEEALQNSSLDRERVLKSYDQFLATVRDMRLKKEGDYNRNLRDALALQFAMNIDDRSGLYNNDLNPRDLVSIKANDIPAFDPKTIAFSGVDSASIEEALKRAGEKYAAALEEATSHYVLEKLKAAQNYSVHVDALDKIFLKDGNKQTVPLQVTILSKKTAHVSHRYVHEDKDLRLEDDGGKLVFSSKSKKSIEIDTLTAHYGKQVVSFPLNIHLAPGAVISLERSDKRLKLPRREGYQNVSKDSLQGQTLSVGYDVKYKASGRRAQRRSLNKVETHQVYDLVK